MTVVAQDRMEATTPQPSGSPAHAAVNWQSGAGRINGGRVKAAETWRGGKGKGKHKARITPDNAQSITTRV
jgi:hypothetical protein